MDNSNVSLTVDFRFLRLDKFQAYSLEREIKGAWHKEGEAGCFAAYVPLTLENFDDINDFYVRQRVILDACDILVTVKTTTPTEQVIVPDIVNRMLKYIDCRLSFSFIVLQ